MGKSSFSSLFDREEYLNYLVVTHPLSSPLSSSSVFLPAPTPPPHCGRPLDSLVAHRRRCMEDRRGGGRPDAGGVGGDVCGGGVETAAGES